jgi:hypothetical protein
LVEARNTCLTRENELTDLEKQSADAGNAGESFAQMDAYRRPERIWESAMKRVSDLAEDLVVCQCLIEPSRAALEAPQVDD